MRKYQPIWEQVKATGKATLSACIERHRTIVLGVRKEKTKDIVWKLECSEQRKRYKLIDTSEEDCITFTLTPVSYLSLHSTTEHDL